MKNKTYILLFLIFIFFYLFRLWSVQPLEIPNGASIRIVGRLTEEPYLTASYQIIEIAGIKVKTGRFPTYHYGDKLEVVGKIRRRVINSWKSEFWAYYPEISVTEEPRNLAKRADFKGFLFILRRQIEGVFKRVLPEPQAALLSGIVLGVKQSMSPKFLQNLRQTGTLHVVVASGYNVSVVAGFLVTVFVWFLSRKKALILAFFGIFAYTLMAGAEPPVVRAAIMGSLAYAAQFLGKQKDGVIALGVSAALMLLVNPLILFDIGFQLSFAATAGILSIFPLLTKRFFRFPIFGDDLAVTLSAQAATLPILLLNFGQMSFLSPIINALVLPLIPPIMGLGATIAGIGLVAKPLAYIIAWFAWVPLTYFVKIIEWFGRLPWTSMEVGNLSIWWAVGYYFVLAVLIWRAYRGQRNA